jgi:hypothetical protein
MIAKHVELNINYEDFFLFKYIYFKVLIWKKVNINSALKALECQELYRF